MDDLKSIRTRAQNIGLPFKVWGRLASTPESKIHQPDISHWLDGEVVSASKIERLLAVLKQVEDLCNSTVAKIALNDADNVRIALAKLTEIRATESEPTRNLATAPWQRVSTSAVAPYGTGSDLTSSASGILAGVRSE